MNEFDPKLKKLLKTWSDIEPRANFEANVWRRIRTATPVPRAAWWPSLFEPAWAIAAAMFVGVALGWALAHPRPLGTAGVEFLRGGTLAGSYVEMVRR
jgi:hypothetical protein